MSNKTQLQTNNTNLDALITRVNAAKDTAASLPDAGNGSGSGNIETCTVTLTVPNITCYYIDGNTLELKTTTTTYDNDTTTITVPINSIIAIYNSGSSVITSTGSYSDLFSNSHSAGRYIAYYISGDCLFRPSSNVNPT